MPPTPAEARAALGLAIGRRAEETSAHLSQRPAGSESASPSPEYEAHSHARTILGTLLICRWLITGESADENEKEWISLGGRMAADEGITMADSTRGYYQWRDTLLLIARQEAARLRTPFDVLELVMEVTRASCDSSLLRMARSYDRRLREMNTRLREASLVKSQFLANMSHELRTPLSAIIGYADLLLEGIDGPLTAEQSADVGEIRSSGGSLLGLINDILDLSKIEAGRMTVELSAVPLRDLAENVVASLQPLADQKGLELRVELGAGAGGVRADEIRVRQVLTNLVSNAIKFTAEGAITISSTRAGSEVEVSVIDHGIGIPRDALGVIFEEFRQADGSTTRNYGGSGLGLAICRRLMDLQGGSIGVESAVGEGSRFWFRLPPSGPDAEPPRSRDDAAARPDNVGSLTRDVILVVDDEKPLRELIVRRLAEAGFNTAEAASADQAVRMARELHPAAMTLDVMMPGADGWTVLQRIRSDASLRDIPVIVVSVVDGKQVALELGAFDYLPKPVDRGELLDGLARALPDLAGADVLCVDDEAGSIESVRRTLAAAGCQVRVARSGEEGLAAIDAAIPDAVFVDLMMPGMNGFEMVARLRSRERLRSVPIIVLTARDLTAEDRATLSAHVDRIISKSELRAADLCATVRQALGHRLRTAAV